MTIGDPVELDQAQTHKVGPGIVSRLKGCRGVVVAVDAHANRYEVAWANGSGTPVTDVGLRMGWPRELLKSVSSPGC